MKAQWVSARQLDGIQIADKDERSSSKVWRHLKHQNYSIFDFMTYDVACLFI